MSHPHLLRDAAERKPNEASETSTAATPDCALERQLWARLGAAPVAGLGVRVRGGLVRLTGRLDRLWKKRSIEAVAARIPGVRAIDARGLEVAPSGLSDGQIADSLRALIRGASSIEDRTLGISVHEGHVVVLGAVAAPEEWQHLHDLLVLAKGVRSVTNCTSIAPRRKRTHLGVARRVESELRARVPHSDEIRLAVVGRVALLRGRASAPVSRQAEQLARRDPAVERVLNRLQPTLSEAEPPRSALRR